jgi:hypothetical protein
MTAGDTLPQSLQVWLIIKGPATPTVTRAAVTAIARYCTLLQCAYRTPASPPRDYWRYTVTVPRRVAKYAGHRGINRYACRSNRHDTLCLNAMRRAHATHAGGWTCDMTKLRCVSCITSRSLSSRYNLWHVQHLCVVHSRQLPASTIATPQLCSLIARPLLDLRYLS